MCSLGLWNCLFDSRVTILPMSNDKIVIKYLLETPTFTRYYFDVNRTKMYNISSLMLFETNLFDLLSFNINLFVMLYVRYIIM